MIYELEPAWQADELEEEQDDVADKKAKIKTEATCHGFLRCFLMSFARIWIGILCRGHVSWPGSHAERHPLHGEQGEFGNLWMWP